MLAQQNLRNYILLKKSTNKLNCLLQMEALRNSFWKYQNQNPVFLNSNSWNIDKMRISGVTLLPFSDEKMRNKCTLPGGMDFLPMRNEPAHESSFRVIWNCVCHLAEVRIRFDE